MSDRAEQERDAREPDTGAFPVWMANTMDTAGVPVDVVRAYRATVTPFLAILRAAERGYEERGEARGGWGEARSFSPLLGCANADGPGAILLTSMRHLVDAGEALAVVVEKTLVYSAERAQRWHRLRRIARWDGAGHDVPAAAPAAPPVALEILRAVLERGVFDLASGLMQDEEDALRAFLAASGTPAGPYRAEEKA